eukprot:3315840-Pleurochrysis_carterae.AAC.1
MLTASRTCHGQSSSLYKRRGHFRMLRQAATADCTERRSVLDSGADTESDPQTQAEACRHENATTQHTPHHVHV